MKTRSNLLLLLVISLTTTGWAYAESTDLAARGHFIYRGGKPLLLLGDTVWPLAVRFKDIQIQDYLDNAQTLGFNVIGLFETTTWASYDKRGKNVFGQHPYRNLHPWQLNDAYWQRYKYVIGEAGRRNIYVYFCVGGPLRPKSIWSKLDTAQKAYDYGNALGRFFTDVNRNILWSPASDQNPETVDRARVDDVAEGIADGVNGITRHDGKADYRSTFMSYHTCGRKATVDYFHDKPWLDFNGFQTWKSYEVMVPLARKQYGKKPFKPGICHEPAYEGDLSHKDKEVKTGWHCRLEAYWDLFSGSCGHINGTTGIWDLGTRQWTSYRDGLRAEGRNDMQWVRKLLESKPLDRYVPDQSLIASDTGEPDRDKDFLCAVRGKDYGYIFVYTTNGRSFTLDLSRWKDKKASIRWYDPRTGAYTKRDVFTARGKRAFDPPGQAKAGNDWVLVLERIQ